MIEKSIKVVRERLKELVEESERLEKCTNHKGRRVANCENAITLNFDLLTSLMQNAKSRNFLQ